MNAINNNDIVISRRAIVRFVYVMIYLYICALNYKRVIAYFNKKADVKEQEEIRPILPQDEVVEDEVVEDEVEAVVAEVANEVVISKAETVLSKAETVVNLEKDVNTWHTIEDGKCRYKGEWKNGLPNGKGIKHFYKTDSYI